MSTNIRTYTQAHPAHTLNVCETDITHNTHKYMICLASVQELLHSSNSGFRTINFRQPCVFHLVTNSIYSLEFGARFWWIGALLLLLRAWGQPVI